MTKRFLMIVVLGLLWCNVGFARDLKNIVQTLRCYSSGLWLYSLDISKDDNTHGYVSELNSWGEKKPELTLIITAKEVEPNIWKGDVLLINNIGKEEYKLTKIDDVGNNFRELHAGKIYSDGDVGSLRLTDQITSNTKYGDDDTKKEIYYDLERTLFSNVKALKGKKKIFNMYSGEHFTSSAATLVCFK